MPVSRLERRLRRRLAANVARLRKDRGLTIEAAAELADLDRRHWQKIEAGDIGVPLGTLARLGKALRVDVVELLRESTT